MTEQKKYKLSAKTREITGKKVKQLRKQDLIPAILYGHSTDPVCLSVVKTEFKKIYSEAGSSSLVELKIDDKNAVKVITYEPQYNPVSDEPIHIDFYKVRMDEKIKTEIPLEFIGESDAVTKEDGSLVTNKDNVEVECLPADLIPMIEVDISVLKTFDDQITVADLKVPSGIEILSESEEVIAMVEPPRSEEEMAELDESAAEQEQQAIEQMTSEASTENKEESGEEQSKEE